VASATFEGIPNKALSHVQTQTVQEGKIKTDNPDLHVQHEAVLYLKANLECLRGNTTKSMKLCSEARLAGRRSRSEQTGGLEVERPHSRIDSESGVDGKDSKDDAPESIETQMTNHYDEAIYYNNLALVHQSAGKYHLGLYYYSIALDCMSKISQLDTHTQDEIPSFFWSDGIACPDVTAEILSNVSLCAFQAGEFEKAYNSMVRCVNVSPGIFGKRPRCWLRMGQSCIGENSYIMVAFAEGLVHLIFFVHP
jgi:hypothetical protein